MIKVVDSTPMDWKEQIEYCKSFKRQGFMSNKYDSYLKNLTEPYKSSLIFLEDEKKLNFLLTRLAMVLNDSSTITEKSRTDLLVDYLDREGGPFKNHLFIGLGRVTYIFDIKSLIGYDSY